MSDIMINICCSDDTPQRNSPTRKEKRKRKKKPFHKKMPYFEANGHLKDKRNNCYKKGSQKDQNLHENGAVTQPGPPTPATQNECLPYLHNTSSACHSSSMPSTSSLNRPSTTFTVKNEGSDEKPQESVNKRATTPSHFMSASHKPATTFVGNPTKYLAIDCEMVGAGPKGRINQLARCSIVSYDGDVVYDKFIKPSMCVSDYRTRWSGIRPRDLIEATPFSEARKEILKLLAGKVVVGHAIYNDFKAISYVHPSAMTRDTSRIPLLNRKAGFGEKECASLRRLTKAIFNRDIQVGKMGHCSVEDAKATMELYKVVEEEWERTLLFKSQAT